MKKTEIIDLYIKSEIERLTSKNNRADMIKSFEDYFVNEVFNDDYIATIEELQNTMDDWLADKCHQCEYCGEYELANKAIDTDDGYFCSDSCHNEYKQDLTDDDSESEKDFWSKNIGLCD